MSRDRSKNLPVSITANRIGRILTAGLAASCVFLTSCRQASSLDAPAETTFSELKRITSELEQFEYLGCDTSHYYFRVPDHGTLKLSFTEIDPSTGEPELPLFRLVSEGRPDHQGTRLTVTIVHGRIVPTGVSLTESHAATPLWMRVFVVTVVLTGLWLACRPRHPLRIAVKRGDVRVFCGVPKGKAAAVTDFLHSLHLDGNITILGTRDRNRNLRITIRGRIHPGTGQRIRNFLKATL